MLLTVYVTESSHHRTTSNTVKPTQLVKYPAHVLITNNNEKYELKS